MFQPPSAPVAIRGSAAGPLSAYAVAVIALVIIVSALARGSLLNALGLAVLALVGFGALVFTARGTQVEVTPTELIVTRRFRPSWRVPLSDFRFVTENVPVRPRMPALAGWTFHTGSGTEAKLEIAMFAPRDRRKLRTLFSDVIVDADAGLGRR